METEQAPPMGVRLADADAPLPPVKLDPSPEHPKGRWVAVRPIDGKGYQLYREFQQTKDVALLWPIARRVLPEATQEEIDALTPAQCVAVISIAVGKADAVQAVLKNAARPPRETAVATAPRSRSRRTTKRST